MIVVEITKQSRHQLTQVICELALSVTSCVLLTLRLAMFQMRSGFLLKYPAISSHYLRYLPRMHRRKKIMGRIFFFFFNRKASEIQQTTLKKLLPHVMNSDLKRKQEEEK